MNQNKSFKIIKFICGDHHVNIYRHNTAGGQINIYQFRNGELSFGAENVSVLNRFEKTQTYKKICKMLTHK